VNQLDKSRNSSRSPRSSTHAGETSSRLQHSKSRYMWWWQAYLQLCTSHV